MRRHGSPSLSSHRAGPGWAETWKPPPPVFGKRPALGHAPLTSHWYAAREGHYIPLGGAPKHLRPNDTENSSDLRCEELGKRGLEADEFSPRKAAAWVDCCARPHTGTHARGVRTQPWGLGRPQQ